MPHPLIDIEIEILKDHDLQECHKLCEMVFRENVDFKDIRIIYQEIKNDRHYRLLVAKEKETQRIVGYTTVVIAHNLFDGKRPFMTLWFVCVHPDYRELGIGHALFKKIEKLAVEENCELIYFTSESDNIVAHKFYEKCGYDSKVEKAFYKFFT